MFNPSYHGYVIKKMKKKVSDITAQNEQLINDLYYMYYGSCDLAFSACCVAMLATTTKKMCLGKHATSILSQNRENTVGARHHCWSV